MTKQLAVRAVLLAAAAVVSGAQLASAKTWTGAGADGNWSTGANWGGTAINGTSDTAVFAGTTNLTTNNNLTSASVAAITFNAGAGAFTLNGNAVSLAGIVANNSTSLQTINIGLNMTAGRSFTTTTGGGNLNITGAIAGDGTNNYLVTLAGTGSGTAGSITATGISVTSTGSWTLSSANTFSGVSSTSQNDSLALTTGVVLTSSPNTILTVSDNGALGDATKTLLIGSGTAAGPTLNLGGTGPRTFGNQIVTNNANFTITGNDLKANGTLIFSGSNTITVNNNSTFSGGINIRNNVSSGARTIVFAGSGNVTVDSAISNGLDTNTAFIGGVQYSGTGTMKLSGTNTYTGLTTVGSSTVASSVLVMNGTHSPANIAGTITGGGYSVYGTLAGTGTINPASGVANAVVINSGGTLAPGDASQASTAQQTGTLDVGNNIVFNTSATNSSAFNVQLGGATAGDGQGFYDQVNMTSATGGITLNTGINLNVSLVNGFTPTASSVFYILTRADSGAYGANAFLNLAEGATVNLGNSITGMITYKANWTGSDAGSSTSGGNDIAIYNISVPEPASLGVLAIGAIALLHRRRTV